MRFPLQQSSHIQHPDTTNIQRVGVNGDRAFAAVAASGMQARLHLALLVERFRRFNQNTFGLPFGESCLQAWLRQWPGAAQVERFGLPRHNLERRLGGDALTLWVRPRDLVQDANHAPRGQGHRPSSMALIWDGDWDLRRSDLRYGVGTELSEVQDIVTHRDRLQDSQVYRRFLRALQEGRPHRSHRQGISLDSVPRIRTYLEIYLSFVDDMAADGYQPERATDPIGVVISRQGHVLKYRNGRHRLAMTQWLDLPSIPVRVMHVHRLWWNRVADGATGQAALDRVCAALPQCQPQWVPAASGAPGQSAQPYVQWPE